MFGIQDFEIDCGVAIFAVSHINGQDRQGILWGLALFPDGLEGVDGKRMPEAVGRWTGECGVGNDLFGLVNTDV